MPSLSNQIVAYLASQYPLVVHGGELQRLAMDSGFVPSNCSRRCRELQNEGKIQVIYNEKHEATYKWIPKSQTSTNKIANDFLKDYAPKNDIDKELDSNQLSIDF